MRSPAVIAAILLTAALGQAADPEMAVTHHQVHANGQILRYTARAGLLPIRNNDAGDIHAHIFFVAYTLDRADGQPARPVTFIWNGGPGANSTLVHLSGFGPRRLKSSDDPAVSPPPAAALEDNDATWLEFTDLVFVDPVGTGFSRPVKAEFGAEFYSTLGDIASVAEFIRVYRTHFDAFDGPLFLAGESYGTWRASGVAEALEKRGQHVSGVMLISGGIQMGPVSPDPVRVALFAPNRSAAAFYHHKLAPELQRDEQAMLKEVENWALAEYAPAWERRDQLSDSERDKIIAQLARYTGVDPSAIDRKTLSMTSPQFTAALFRDQKLQLGRYDMRLKGPAAPSDPARNAIIMRYLREDIEFKTDLAYQGIEEGFSPTAAAGPGGIGSRWAWDQVDKNQTTAVSNVGSGDGPPPAQPWLRRAMTLDHALKVFLVAGMYDSLNSCADNNYLVSHLQPEFRRNITQGCYRGGHMMYDTKEARYNLKRDAAQFIQNAGK
jgi:carboxypeptidase C (cathepsin A)